MDAIAQLYLLPPLTGAEAPGRAPIIAQLRASVVAQNSAVFLAPTLLAGTAVTWSALNLPPGATIDPNTGSITGIVTTLGQYQITITASNSQGSYNVWASISVVAATIDIDEAWISAAGSTPYKLNVANATYRLTQDITVPESAFAFQADNVTLDLAGRIITYNNAPRTIIPNEDFNNFTGTEPDNWTVTGTSSHDKIAKASSYVYPRKMCEGTYALRCNLVQRTSTACTLNTGTPATITATAHGLTTGDAVILNGFSATSYGVASTNSIFGGYVVTVIDANTFSINADVSAVSDNTGTFTRAALIESSAIPLPVNNRLYSLSAFVTNSDTNGAKQYHTSIKLVDVATGKELEKLDGNGDGWGSYAPTYINNGTRNHSPAIIVKSATVAHAKAQIFLATTDASVTIDTCRVRLAQAYDNGVVARGNNGTDYPQRFNYNTTGWTTSSNLGPLAVIDSVGGGSITQGQNRGMRCWPIMLRKCAGATIHSAQWKHTGDDPCIMLDHATLLTPTNARSLLISNNACETSGVVNASRRDSQLANIAYRGWLGAVTIADNTIDGSPTISVSGTTSAPATYATLWHRNTIRPKTVVTNSYAMACSTSYVTISQNNVNSVSTIGGSGRGLLLNGGQNITVSNVTITDNEFRCREHRHREVVNDVNAYTRAFRMRNTENGEGTNGTLRNIVSSGNLYHCECTDNEYSNVPQGARWSIRYNGNGMDLNGVVSNNDTFSAINTVGNGAAMAIEIGRKDSEAADVLMSSPKFTGNHRLFKLHGQDDGTKTIDGIHIAGATFTKAPTPGAPSGFYTFDFGYTSGSATTDVNILENIFGPGTAPTDITQIGTHSAVVIEP